MYAGAWVGFWGKGEGEMGGGVQNVVLRILFFNICLNEFCSFPFLFPIRPPPPPSPPPLSHSLQEAISVGYQFPISSPLSESAFAALPEWGVFPRAKPLSADYSFFIQYLDLHASFLRYSEEGDCYLWGLLGEKDLWGNKKGF